MEDTLLIDAVERFVNGEMSAQEKIYFEDLRKNNPELDQAVVEQLFFLNELNNYGGTKSFKHALHEVEANLASEGFISKAPAKQPAKVIQLWNKYKRITAVAASIAGLVSIFIASVVSTVTNKGKEGDLKLLSDITKIQGDSINKMSIKLDSLAESKNNSLPAVTKSTSVTKVVSKFRATGFLIDPNNNYIVTNAHVINDAKNYLIIENNKGQQFSARSIYVNKQNDIAILKVTDKDFKMLPSLPYSIRKRNADLGEQVFMLGFPKQEIVYGEGYVSAKNGFKMDTTYCQLNTSANEGSSGSPVITKNGELIGIITSAENDADGVVFAIKSANIYRAADEVKKMKDYSDIKISSGSALRGLSRETQIKKMEDYVFMIKGN